MSTSLTNQRGIALFTVLGLLSILLILASIVASSSRIESALTGTDRRSAQAFNAADGGLGYALGDADNFIQLATRCTDLTTAGLPLNGNVCARFEYEAPPPIEIKVSALKFKGFYFDVEGVGLATNNAQSNLDMEATRLGPAS